ARLHQRWAPRRRHAAGNRDGRKSLLRDHAYGASRALLRSARPDHESVGLKKDLRVERQVLQIADGEPVAAPAAEDTSAGLDSGKRQSQHLGFYRQARPLLLLSQLLRE